MMMTKKLLVMLFLILSVSVLGCVDYGGRTPTPIPTPQPTLTPTLTQEEKNIQIVQNIVEEYHKTHTYSERDFFVCADMAIDVWNMVKTQGINAQIAIGNVSNPDANWTECNHAWVLAEVSPATWLALETTGGYVVYRDTNENYYRAYRFDNPREFKEYLELIKEYNAQVDRINNLYKEYSDTYDEWVKEANYHGYLVNECNRKWQDCLNLQSEIEYLVNEYNRRYAGRSLTPSEYQDALALQSEIEYLKNEYNRRYQDYLNLQSKRDTQYAVVERVSGRADQLVHTIDEENKRLLEVSNQITGLLT